jgi:2-polyprenyl-3-methyl-5-hydroxy-6-metoxy-1,4-benzoquinol methylase
MPKAVTTKEYWDRYWGEDKPRFATYDISRGQFHSYHLLLSECLPRTRARLGIRRLRLVDCGCGEGLILRFVREQQPDVDVWGIDYSDAIEKARRMGEELGYDFHLIKGDLFEVCRSGESGSFDVLMSMGLIEHFEDPAWVLTQLARIVTPGGCMITVIPNFDGPFNFFWRLFDPSNYRHHVPISNARLVEMHKAIGLEDVMFHTMGTPSIPGITDAHDKWQKMLNWVLVQINGRILQRVWPRQGSLAQRHAMTPAVACVGWKPLPSSTDIREPALRR